jgi:probable DNA metabolism protein
MGVATRRALPFLCCDGWGPGPLALPARRTDAAGAQTAAGAPKAGARLVFVFDGTFDGLLSAVFDAYAQKRWPDAVEAQEMLTPGLFEDRVRIDTDAAKAARVWGALKTHLGANRQRQVALAFLAGCRGAATAIYRFLRDSLPAGGSRGRPPADLHAHLAVSRLAQQVSREAHRFKGFVRFSRVDEDQYLALIEPRHDVLPLLQRHFEERYADQKWVIYDVKRGYGLSFDRQRTTVIHRDPAGLTAGPDDPQDPEARARALWRRYFAAASVEQRANHRLQLSKVPRRFRRYLTEMQTP